MGPGSSGNPAGRSPPRRSPRPPSCGPSRRRHRPPPCPAPPRPAGPPRGGFRRAFPPPPAPPRPLSHDRHPGGLRPRHQQRGPTAGWYAPTAKMSAAPPRSPAVKMFLHVLVLAALSLGLVIAWLRAGAAQQRVKELEAELKKEHQDREDEVNLCLDDLKLLSNRLATVEGRLGVLPVRKG